MPSITGVPVRNVYVYTSPANPIAPPPPLLGPVNGQMNQNDYQLPGGANGAIQVGVVYELSIGPMAPRNRGTQATCLQVAPPHFVFRV